MKRFQHVLFALHPLLLSSIALALMGAQIILAILFHGYSSEAVQWAGWICLWTSGIFGTLPIITFRVKGSVPKGKSYMKTTKLVDTGIYAIARHPQGGTAWLLINLGIMLVAGHWTSIAAGLPSMALAYLDTYKSDQYCLEKFGDEYRQYMRRVPRVNFFLGIIRLASRAIANHSKS